MAQRQSDIRVLRCQASFADATAREPLKFGSSVLEAATYCLVELEAETRAGVRGVGHGGMLLSDFWAFPDPRVAHRLRERAMVEVARRFCRLCEEFPGCAHPMDIARELHGEVDPLAAEVSAELALPVPLPRLAALVATSPADCALHDAFGMANRICTYEGYGPRFANDLTADLGPAFRRVYADEVLVAEPRRHLDAFHLVGGLDALREEDVPSGAPEDGLPHSLEGWIRRDGLRCLKVKLRGNDLRWDLARLEEVHAVARTVHQAMGIRDLRLSLDPNEQCESPDYMVELLTRLQERRPSAYGCVAYLEQPTSRQMRAERHDMRRLARLKPVLVDESLSSLEDFALARELGWSGIALKTCKGHTGCLLFAALARKHGALMAFQDLSNPGISLVHSAGLAARLRGISSLEANSCQYFPLANRAAATVHPGVFRRRGGRLCLDSIRGAGLGLRWDELQPGRA